MSGMVRVHAAALRTLIERVAFAAYQPEDDDDYGRHLATVRLHVDGDVLAAVATNGHQLAKATAPVAEAKSQRPFAVTMSVELARAVVESLERFADSVSVLVENGSLILRQYPEGRALGTAHCAFPIPRISKQFPDYFGVIPDRWAYTIRFAAADLLVAGQRALTRDVFECADWLRGVRLQSNGERLQITAGTRARSFGSIPCTGDAFDERPLRLSYLLQMVAAAPGDTVEMRLPADAEQPFGFFTPAELNWLGIVMPIRTEESVVSCRRGGDASGKVTQLRRG